MGLLDGGADTAVVGFDAGWTLAFHAAAPDGAPLPATPDDLVLSRTGHAASLRVDAEAAWRPATFEATVDGVTEQDLHRMIRERLVYVTLKLGWRDLGSGFMAGLATAAATFTGGLTRDDDDLVEVMTARVRRVERLHGDVRYRTRIAGVDARFHLLQVRDAPVEGAEAGQNLQDYVRRVAGAATSVLLQGTAGPCSQAIDEPINLPEGIKAADAVGRLVTQVVGHPVDRRTAYLRSEGLWLDHLQGEGETVPSHDLTLATGVVTTRPLVEDRTLDDPALDPFAAEAATVTRAEVVLRGRPEIEIGDVVRLELDLPAPGDPPSVVSTNPLGPLGDAVVGVGQAFTATTPPDLKPFRVVAVQHRLGPADGFATTLTVEEAATAVGSRPAGGSEADRVASALGSRSTGGDRHPAAPLRLGANVGVVGRQTPSSPPAEGRFVRRPQRVDVQEGLAPRPTAGGPPIVVNRPVRAPYGERQHRVENKPYLTPFAFGKTGLVVPHYPGQRVLDVHLDGLEADAIVAGSLWKDGQEPVSDPGDWWLNLPVGWETRESSDDPATASVPTGGEATNDLTDGDGGRVIEVKGLRISVGPDALGTAGTRPTAAAADEVLIEHPTGGASIAIDSDGNITITTDETITFTARNVVFQVDDTVEVNP
jgi:hypothetical protein